MCLDILIESENLKKMSFDGRKGKCIYFTSDIASVACGQTKRQAKGLKDRRTDR